MGKSSVAILQEYCSKNKIAVAHYDFIPNEEGGFVCKAEFLNNMVYGQGRSKRDAKHEAAAALIKKLRYDYPDIDDVHVVRENIKNSDMVATLRDYCIKNSNPLPQMSVVQQAGSPDAPEFTILCQIGSVKRYGVSETKKDARQKAAEEMLIAISEEEYILDGCSKIQLLSDLKDSKEGRYKKFSTYREYLDSKEKTDPAVPLSEKCFFFHKFHEELKSGAHGIIAKKYESCKEQAIDLFRALKLTPKISPWDCLTGDALFIEFDCDLDIVFAGPESKVYCDIIKYFDNMLDERFLN